MVEPGLVLRFLDDHTTLTLACVDPDGPWAADVYYVRVGSALCFYSSPASRHARAFQADPRGAGTVHGDAEGWRDIRGVQIAGRVELVPDAEAREVREDYLLKFPFARPLLTGPGGFLARVRLYRLLPGEAFWIDNETGLGARDRVTL